MIISFLLHSLKMLISESTSIKINNYYSILSIFSEQSSTLSHPVICKSLLEIIFCCYLLMITNGISLEFFSFCILGRDVYYHLTNTSILVSFLADRYWYHVFTYFSSIGHNTLEYGYCTDGQFIPSKQERIWYFMNSDIVKQV